MYGNFKNIFEEVGVSQDGQKATKQRVTNV